MYSSRGSASSLHPDSRVTGSGTATTVNSNESMSARSDSGSTEGNTTRARPVLKSTRRNVGASRSREQRNS